MKGIYRYLYPKSCVMIPAFALMIFTLFLSGCSAPPKTFNPGVSGPQMIVEPGAVSLGIAKLKETQIVFRGKGFEPDDSVFVQLLNVEKDGKASDIPIAEGKVDERGRFAAEVGTLTKVTDFLRAKVGMNKDLENIIIVTRPPIKAGLYTARAVSMQSDITAECTLNIEEPCFTDRIMDRLGMWMGKIRKK